MSTNGKPALYALVMRCATCGVRVPADLANLLGISDTHARRVLMDLGVYRPRRPLTELEQRLPVELRNAIQAYRQCRKPTSESKTKVEQT